MPRFVETQVVGGWGRKPAFLWLTNQSAPFFSRQKKIRRKKERNHVVWIKKEKHRESQFFASAPLLLLFSDNEKREKKNGTSEKERRCTKEYSLEIETHREIGPAGYKGDWCNGKIFILSAFTKFTFRLCMRSTRSAQSISSGERRTPKTKRAKWSRLVNATNVL